MQTIIGVRFKKAGKIYYYSPGQLDIELGDNVIVDTARGTECGVTVLAPREVEDSEIVKPLKVVHRIASDQDLQRLAENREREKEAFAVCEQKIADRGLAMKLVEVEYTFDMNKIIFYFTADGRIDFRELVKDLAAVFRTRIELRQIGVRDEAKLRGGIGCCGRPLCCASFLGEFAPVSIKMAKDQNLSLNPTKISGICGRLMCCLKYEEECYKNGEMCNNCQLHQTEAPEQGSRVRTDEGHGRVISLNEQRRTATILLDNTRTVVKTWDDVVAAEVEDDVVVEVESDEPQRRPERQRRSASAGNEEHDSRSQRPRRSRNRGERNDRRPRRNGGEENEERQTRSRRPRDGHRRPRGNAKSRSRDNRSGENRSADRGPQPGDK